MAYVSTATCISPTPLSWSRSTPAKGLARLLPTLFNRPVPLASPFFSPSSSCFNSRTFRRCFCSHSSHSSSSQTDSDMVLSRIVSLNSRNVFTNLAAEQRLFERTSGHMLIFYVNSPCIVMGRTQNPFVETDISLAMSQRVPIARRRSGGGTVVHDEGNLNICFIRPRDEHDPCLNAKLLSGVLKDDFGIRATLNKRGDVLVDDAKVSGSAYRLTRDRAYHHATLLIDSDLSRLRQLLRSPLKTRLDAMGTKSVSSSVTNLAECTATDIDVLSVMQAIANRWTGRAEQARIQDVSPSQVEREVGGMQAERGELCSHGWIFGQTPRFVLHGSGDAAAVSGEGRAQEKNDHHVEISVKKGLVVDGVSVNEPQGEQMRVTDQIRERLSGQPFNAASLTDALDQLPGDMNNDGVVQVVRRAVGDIPQTWMDENGEAAADLRSHGSSSSSSTPRRRSRLSSQPVLIWLAIFLVIVSSTGTVTIEAFSLRQWSAAMHKVTDDRSLDRSKTAGDKVKATAFTNTCRCACCYQVGEHSECVSPTYTMFDVLTCTNCNVESCMERFPISCNEPTSAVNTVCIVRKGWLIRLVPMVFLVISACLLIYGMCFKKYDGYNPSGPLEPLLRRNRGARSVDQRASVGATLSS